MQYRALLLTICILLFSSAHTVYGAPNAGFVEGLWYANDPVFANVENRIYVAFRNNTEHDLSGTIRFTENGTRIGSSEVHALSGRLVEAWVDWKPTYGEHTLTAALSGAEIHAIGKTVESFSSDDIMVSEKITVDYDTDNDTIGNEVDTDDDGDTVSDADERARGSDPLVKNPIPETKSASDEKEEQSENKKKESIDDIEKDTDTASTGTKRGLEQYMGDGTPSTLLANVTEKVEIAKDTLDTYREKRNETLYPQNEGDNLTNTSTSTSHTATITRTKIDSESSFLQSFIDGIRTIFQNVWTFFLFILSKALGHPALVQILILVMILYMCYRLMRRVGRRPIDS